MPENVGKYMRKLVIANLRNAVEAARNASAGVNYDASELQSELELEAAPFEELNVCCHGRAAAPDVRA